METLSSIDNYKISSTPPIDREQEISIKLPSPPPEKPEKTTISMKGDDFMKDFINQPTVPYETSSKDDNFTNQDINEVARQIQKEEEETEKFSMEDMLDIANTIIDIIDTVASTGLRWYAKDNTDSPYQLNQDKKKKLARSLARILVKYQTKFSLEFLFLLAVIAAYIGPFMRAKEMRKMYNEQNRKKIVREHEKKVFNQKEEESIQEEITEDVPKKSSSKMVDISQVGRSHPETKPDKPMKAVKRPRGRPSKV